MRGRMGESLSGLLRNFYTRACRVVCTNQTNRKMSQALNYDRQCIINIGLRQGSALSRMLVIVVMN